MIRAVREGSALAVMSSVFTRSGKGALLASTCAVGLTLAGAPVSVATAAPTVTITPPANHILRTHTPEFSGTTTDEYPLDPFNPVILNIYEGAGVGGEPVRKVTAEQEPFTKAWSALVTPGLQDGIYTARAEQSEVLGEPEPGESNAVTFTVDTTAPQVTITYPVNGSSASGESQLLTGSAGTAQHDIHKVTIELYAGSTITAPTIATLEVPTSGASWSGAFSPLGPGTYTVQALQSDEAGNTGTSTPDTFTLTAPPSHSIPLPVASFSWFPPSPVIGQTVVLVSGSTDSASPITTFSWDLAGNGPFKVSGPVASTSFSTPGSHAVRLRVTDARGGSSVASETIPVGLPPLKPMQPFPIVRIAGFQTAKGVKLSLLSVQAPVGARATVTCRGRGCRMKPQSRVATTSAHNRHANSVVLAFRRFERSFRAGVTLEVRVSAPGEIGKYTLFAIHRHALPTRIDSCLSALDPKPIACAT